MLQSKRKNHLHWMPFAAITVALLCFTSQAFAQAPGGNEMCGDGTTFTVQLPGLNVLPLGLKAPDDSVTLPNGCHIYALLVSGYERNKTFDELTFYKVAKYVAEHDGYVHYAWWNNLLGEYMSGPLHDVQITIPLLGTSRSTPGGLLGVHAAGFVPLNFVQATTLFPKAIPEEDYQFQADAKLVLQAIRSHNPNAIIIVAGHSMGGEAVARLGTDTTVAIDLLAPTDPVGNRTLPVGQVTNHTYNWTRWRAAQTVWGGFRQADCIRIGPFPLPCKDFDSRLFYVSYRCEPNGVGPLLARPPLIQTRAPGICSGPWIDPGTRRTLKSNIKHLVHRWQKETLFPFDFNADEKFNYSGGNTTTTSGKVIPAQVALGENKLLEFDPLKTCGTDLKTDPRDSTLKCSSGDGHGEIVGFRGLNSSGAVPVGLLGQQWPCYLFDPAKALGSNCANSNGSPARDRRNILIEMVTAPSPDPNKISTDTPAWVHEPLNPNLDMVVDDILDVLKTIVAQQPAPVDSRAPTSTASFSPNANAAGWNNANVAVDLDATDEQGGSGVKEIQYSLTGSGTTVQLGNSAQTMVTAEGVSTLNFFARDNAGTPQSLDVKIDKTQPDITAITDVQPNANGWFKTNVMVSFPASDALSGLAGSTPDMLVTTEGAGQQIDGLATDNADNQASASVTLNIDKTPPVVTAPRSITISATEANGARGNMYADLAYFLSRGFATDALDPAPSRFAPQAGGADADNDTLFPVGTTPVNFLFQDLAGNIGMATANVTVKAPPVGAPLITVALAGQGRPSAESFYFDLLLTNAGDADAFNVRILDLPMKILIGSGNLHRNYRLVALPLMLGNLAAGATTTVRIHVVAAPTVTQFTFTAKGSWRNRSGESELRRFTFTQTFTP